MMLWVRRFFLLFLVRLRKSSLLVPLLLLFFVVAAVVDVVIASGAFVVVVSHSIATTTTATLLLLIALLFFSHDLSCCRVLSLLLDRKIATVLSSGWALLFVVVACLVLSLLFCRRRSDRRFAFLFLNGGVVAVAWQFWRRWTDGRGLCTLLQTV